MHDEFSCLLSSSKFPDQFLSNSKCCWAFLEAKRVIIIKKGNVCISFSWQHCTHSLGSESQVVLFAGSCIIASQRTQPPGRS